MSAGGDHEDGAPPLQVREHEGSAVFEVRVVPRASREGIAGVHAGALKLSLTAPPVEGAANAALIALLAGALGVPKRAVHIARGEQSKNKLVRVDGVRASAVHALARGATTGPR